MASVQSFTFNAFQENTYVVWDETKSCVIIDPGCYEKSEEAELVAFIGEHNLEVKYILNTHGHIDHVLGNYFVRKTFGAPLLMHEIAVQTMQAVKAYAPVYGFQKYTPAEVDGFLKGGDTLQFGNTTFQLLFVPGHAPGHLAFYCKEDAFCINGDVLFRESVGRTDLPGGNHAQQMRSIREVMYALADHTLIYCGHGPTTSIGHEKKHNHFCRL